MDIGLTLCRLDMRLLPIWSAPPEMGTFRMRIEVLIEHVLVYWFALAGPDTLNTSLLMWARLRKHTHTCKDICTLPDKSLVTSNFVWRERCRGGTEFPSVSIAE